MENQVQRVIKVNYYPGFYNYSLTIIGIVKNITDYKIELAPILEIEEDKGTIDFYFHANIFIKFCEDGIMNPSEEDLFQLWKRVRIHEKSKDLLEESEKIIFEELERIKREP